MEVYLCVSASSRNERVYEYRWNASSERKFDQWNYSIKRSWKELDKSIIEIEDFTSFIYRSQHAGSIYPEAQIGLYLHSEKLLKSFVITMNFLIKSANYDVSQWGHQEENCLQSSRGKLFTVKLKSKMISWYEQQDKIPFLIFLHILFI